MKRPLVIVVMLSAALLTAFAVSVSGYAAADSSTSQRVPAPSVSLGKVDARTRAAIEYRRRHFPAAQRFADRVRLSEKEILTRARAAAATPFTGGASHSAPAKARLMRLGDFDRANGLTTDPLLSPERVVWVVTVHAPTAMLPRPGSPVRKASVYTVVYDAVTGDPIERGVGVAFVR
jgi:hypothetical protein